MDILKVFGTNLRKYREEKNISQEKFAEVLGTTLSYLNQIENNKVDVKSSTIDKFAKNINEYDKNSKIKSEDLVTYSKEHLTNYSRIDEKKKDYFLNKKSFLYYI